MKCKPTKFVSRGKQTNIEPIGMTQGSNWAIHWWVLVVRRATLHPNERYGYNHISLSVDQSTCV